MKPSFWFDEIWKVEVSEKLGIKIVRGVWKRLALALQMIPRVLHSSTVGKHTQNENSEVASQF
jgi:hypothetical protein